MGLGEQLNDLDRKVLGAAPVDRAGPAPEYQPEVGDLAPLARSLSVRAALYGVGALALGLHMLFGKRWMTLLVVGGIVVVTSMLIARLSTNAFPTRFPEAPTEALATGRAGQAPRLVLAAAGATFALLDVLLWDGTAEELLFILIGLAAGVLWSVAAEVTSREEDGYVLAARASQRGRLGRGIYRVAKT